MEAITTVGLDIAKSVFQGSRHRCGGEGDDPPSAETPACSGVLSEATCLRRGDRSLRESHLWSREIRALGPVRLMPAAYVKPYVKRQKNDAADAEAICEAVTRANMRFVETKSPERRPASCYTGPVRS